MSGKGAPIMREHDIRSVAGLAGEAGTVLTSLIRDMHMGIAGRVFGAVGPAAKPAQVIHDAIGTAVYRAVDGGVRGASHGGGALAGRLWGRDDDPPLELRPKIRAGAAALNGLYGHQLAAHGNGFTHPMQIRHHDEVVPLTGEALAQAYPDATARVVVFIHGVFLTELSWWRPPRTGADTRSYGERLRQNRGYTPIYLRYNSGLHISDNGQSLSGLLLRLTDLWPVPVDEIVLVGHSMGGLVARSACHYGEQQRHRWTELARHVVCLGSPHLGSEVEKAVNAASWAFAKLPETQGISQFLNRRSVGIKDLRYGACVEEDWRGHDPDEFLRDRCTEVPFLGGATYHFVATTAAPKALGLLTGDHLVRSYSASGTGKNRSIPFQPSHGLTLAGMHHFDLLNHPKIYAKLDEWLGQSALTFAVSDWP